MINVIKKYISQRCAGVTLCIKEHTVEASEARWIADPFIDQLRFGLVWFFMCLIFIKILWGNIVKP